MPTYQYECSACGYRMDKMQSMTSPKLIQCPACHKDTLHRLIGTGGGIIFKGDGFYETDYKKKACPSSESCPSSTPGNSCGCSGGCNHSA